MKENGNEKERSYFRCRANFGAVIDDLRRRSYLLHLLGILPERAERNRNFEVDDLLPWSKEIVARICEDCLNVF